MTTMTAGRNSTGVKRAASSARFSAQHETVLKPQRIAQILHDFAPLDIHRGEEPTYSDPSKEQILNIL